MNPKFWNKIYREVLITHIRNNVLGVRGSIILNQLKPHSRALSEYREEIEKQHDKKLIQVTPEPSDDEDAMLDEWNDEMHHTFRSLVDLREVFLGDEEQFRVVNGLITDMQGMESIESADILWDIAQEYNHTTTHYDRKPENAITAFIHQILFCAGVSFSGAEYMTFADMRRYGATFSREAVSRYFKVPPPANIPIGSSIILIFWKMQISFGYCPSTNIGRYAHSEIQNMQKSSDPVKFKIGERFANMLRPYADVCGKVVLYSMRVRSTPKQMENLESLIMEAAYDDSDANMAFSSALMATSTSDTYCTSHIGMGWRNRGGLPVLLELDTSLIQDKRYFIHVNHLLTDGYVDDAKTYGLPPKNESEILVLPGLLIRYHCIEEMRWGYHDGYKVEAQFIDTAPKNVMPQVILNSRFG